ncbi:MAG: dihydrolipoyl dehydrogenase, partial [Myxococcaceae bacterium]|nr:dihydrolipoyl dehydrogenase [Myxococcaceae bacterium]
MKRVPYVLVGLLAIASPSVARAQDESLDAAAEARFKEGVSYAKQGKYDQARGSFLQTLALSPGSPKVLLNLAISEHGAGHPVEALGHLKMYLASPKVDPKKAQEIRQSLYEELWRATGHLKIQADRGDSIVLDGDVKLGNAPLADVVDVSTGKHRVAGGSRTVEVTVSAGETKEILVATEHPAAAAAPIEPRPGPDHVSPPPEEPKATIWKPMTFVLGGATLVAGGSALLFNVKSNNASDRAEPPIPGLDDAHCLVSSELLEIDHVPERLVVLGGGVIGCEFASIFSHFGSQVTIVEMLPNLIGKEDADAVAALQRAFKRRGIEVALGARATRVERQEDGLRLVYADANDKEHVVGADRILVATGRIANVEDLGLEAAGVPAERRRIPVDSSMRTNVPHIFATGDVAGNWQLAHTAFREGEVAAENALGHDAEIDYRSTPRCTYTDPEVAAVGL